MCLSSFLVLCRGHQTQSFRFLLRALTDDVANSAQAFNAVGRAYCRLRHAKVGNMLLSMKICEVAQGAVCVPHGLISEVMCWQQTGLRKRQGASFRCMTNQSWTCRKRKLCKGFVLDFLSSCMCTRVCERNSACVCVSVKVCFWFFIPDI